MGLVSGKEAKDSSDPEQCQFESLGQSNGRVFWDGNGNGRDWFTAVGTNLYGHGGMPCFGGFEDSHHCL